MPRYDLHCPTCDTTVEVVRGMNQDNPPCRTCGGPQEQLPSTGTGFTISGYAARNGYTKGSK